MRLTPLKLVDDTEAKQELVGLATGGQGQQPVSMQTIMDRLGVDPAEERTKRLQWALDEARFTIEMQREVEKLQNTLAQQVQAEVAGAAGLSYDQQKVIAKADEVVQSLQGLDEGTRRSQLHALQSEDGVMYAVVIQRLQVQDNAQAAALKQQMNPQGGQG